MHKRADQTNSSDPILRVDHIVPLGKKKVHLPAGSNNRNLEQWYFLANVSFGLPLTLMQNNHSTKTKYNSLNGRVTDQMRNQTLLLLT